MLNKRGEREALSPILAETASDKCLFSIKTITFALIFSTEFVNLSLVVYKQRLLIRAFVIMLHLCKSPIHM